jgi:hypothetical protein
MPSAAFAMSGGLPAAWAENGDTHVTGQGTVERLGCNGSTRLDRIPA